MRIISGNYRGKLIHPGKDFSARPTTDFAKESLFNILANRFEFDSVEVLDLFSGTGGIAYEFASRDCIQVDVVESNKRHAAFIQKTGKELKFGQLKIFQMDAFQFLKNCRHKYDLIFADPPYDMEESESLPDLILSLGLLKENGCFILEHSKSMNFSKHEKMTDHRNYGSVNFTFFSK